MTFQAEWLERLQTGEDLEGIFQEIFLANHARVFGYLRSLGHTPEDAEDLTQESFLRVYRKLKGYRGEGDISSWLLSIARNLHLEGWRRRSTQKRSAETKVGIHPTAESSEPLWERLETTDADPQRELLAREELERTLRILAELPEQMRRCFLLRFGRDLKYREIAEIMEISIDTVKSHLHQARTRLRKGLEP